jgi:hypothetical protein
MIPTNKDCAVKKQGDLKAAHDLAQTKLKDALTVMTALDNNHSKNLSTGKNFVGTRKTPPTNPNTTEMEKSEHG